MSDDEVFCPKCCAGLESSEHYEKCEADTWWCEPCGDWQDHPTYMHRGYA